MTPFSIELLDFDRSSVEQWAELNPRHRNCPVVYVIDGPGSGTGAVYIGETINAAARMKQHLDGPKRALGLKDVRVVVDDEFNKSVCLDLESHLIRWFAGDGIRSVLNGNEGITDAQYYRRDRYRSSFRAIFDELYARGLFTRSITQIENSDLFKLSPFKALTETQAVAVEQILESLVADLDDPERVSRSVVEGEPGTGKTVVAIYLMKLIADIGDSTDSDTDPDGRFSEFFATGYRELFTDIRMGLVIPQQSLRESVRRVFKKTPKLHERMVLSPWDVADAGDRFDLLLVDEAHRLNQRASQGSGPMNTKFAAVNERLFGADDVRYTQLDWISARSRHQVLLMDAEQSVRPADLPHETVTAILREAGREHRRFRLMSQMRVKAGADYVGFVRRLLRSESVTLPDLGEYDLRFFDDVGAMRREIRRMDSEHGLARMVAGYAWKWRSKKDKDAFDIELDGEQMRWNSVPTDWISAPGSIDEVGSIHTVQGYDLNYAGVIIGPDLRRNPVTGEIHIDRASYQDRKGKENNGYSKKKYTDDELLTYIRNIYGVLLTRGIRGTFVYVCDPSLREWMRQRLA
ncbi:DUF2075 domain-containing protein [Microbacterium protaetiae]|uniref:DUF2075 domain-containing protein n=1 Tax=Microbacterium protaetiae TaxID=2509458 RepID=A0A4P6EGI5_9MICO|nr:DUF2075 domain-containing protein [Microbacterium protaetiae]QAY59267.1 DUF2075 domain-containing protein [Microbacterium protaetiae]